jgi:6-hydroxycyclohex-1-ene-1-carbonyl-CoA dehydrogenase
VKVQSWVVEKPGAPMVLQPRMERPGPGEVVVEVAGCGVCHTDLGFYYDGVPTRHPFPLTLGHEVSGRVVSAGEGAEAWAGRTVVVPAVIPCGACEACLHGHGSVCPRQIFPGNDVHGGFGTHLRVPAHGLCPVPDLADAVQNPAGLDLAALSVIADAVSTPFQAILRSGLERGDLAIFVGVGGVGGFGAQIASAQGALVVGVDPDPERLALAQRHGVALGLRPDRTAPKDLRKAVRDFGRERGIPTWRTRIFECSGTRAGQETAFGLLGHGSYLSVVGYTAASVEVRLSNVMAFHATVQGNWGCLPKYYPAVVDLVLSGKVALEPFLERRPLASVNETFADLREHRVGRRVVLIPDGKER